MNKKWPTVLLLALAELLVLALGSAFGIWAMRSLRRSPAQRNWPAAAAEAVKTC